MACFDSRAVVFAETLETFANLTSGRRVPHPLSMRMIANTLLSVGTPRAGFVRGRRRGVSSREDSHHSPDPDEPGPQAREILHRLLPRLEAV